MLKSTNTRNKQIQDLILAPLQPLAEIPLMATKLAISAGYSSLFPFIHSLKFISIAQSCTFGNKHNREKGKQSEKCQIQQCSANTHLLLCTAGCPSSRGAVLPPAPNIARRSRACSQGSTIQTTGKKDEKVFSLVRFGGFLIFIF